MKIIIVIIRVEILVVMTIVTIRKHDTTTTTTTATTTTTTATNTTTTPTAAAVAKAPLDSSWGQTGLEQLENADVPNILATPGQGLRGVGFGPGQLDFQRYASVPILRIVRR